MKMIKYILFISILNLSLNSVIISQNTEYINKYFNVLKNNYDHNISVPEAVAYNKECYYISGFNFDQIEYVNSLGKELKTNHFLNNSTYDIYFVLIDGADANEIILSWIGTENGTEAIGRSFCNEVYKKFYAVANETHESENLIRDNIAVLFCFPDCKYTTGKCKNYYYLQLGSSLEQYAPVIENQINESKTGNPGLEDFLTELIKESSLFGKPDNKQAINNDALLYASYFSDEIENNPYDFIYTDFFKEDNDEIDYFEISFVNSENYNEVGFKNFVNSVKHINNGKDDKIKELNQKLLFTALYDNHKYYIFQKKPESVNSRNDIDLFTETLAKNICYKIPQLSFKCNGQNIPAKTQVKIFLYDFIETSGETSVVVRDYSSEDINYISPSFILNKGEDIEDYIEKDLNNFLGTRIIDYNKALENFRAYNSSADIKEKYSLICEKWYSNYESYISVNSDIHGFRKYYYEDINDFNYYHFLFDNYNSNSTFDEGACANNGVNRDIIIVSEYTSTSGKNHATSNLYFGNDVDLTYVQLELEKLKDSDHKDWASTNEDNLIDYGKKPFFYVWAERTADELYHVQIYNIEEAWQDSVKACAELIKKEIFNNRDNRESVNSNNQIKNVFKNYVVSDVDVSGGKLYSEYINDKFQVWDEFTGNKFVVLQKYFDHRLISDKYAVIRFTKDVYEELGPDYNKNLILSIILYYYDVHKNPNNTLSNRLEDSPTQLAGYFTDSPDINVSSQASSMLVPQEKQGYYKLGNDFVFDFTYPLLVYTALYKPYISYAYYLTLTGDVIYKHTKYTEEHELVAGSQYIYNIDYFVDKRIEEEPYQKYYDNFYHTYNSFYTVDPLSDGFGSSYAAGDYSYFNPAHLKMITCMAEDGVLSDGNDSQTDIWKSAPNFKLVTPKKLFKNYLIKERSVPKYHDQLLKLAIRDYYYQPENWNLVDYSKDNPFFSAPHFIARTNLLYIINDNSTPDYNIIFYSETDYLKIVYAVLDGLSFIIEFTPLAPYSIIIDAVHMGVALAAGDYDELAAEITGQLIGLGIDGAIKFGSWGLTTIKSKLDYSNLYKELPNKFPDYDISELSVIPDPNVEGKYVVRELKENGTLGREIANVNGKNIIPVDDVIGDLAKYAGKSDIPVKLASKLGDKVDDLNSALLKHSDEIGGDFGKILDDVDVAIDNKSVIEIVEDNNQGTIFIYTTRGDKTNAAISIQKSSPTHPTHKGDYFVTKYEPTYKIDANPDIDVPMSKNGLVPDYKNTPYLHPLNKNHTIRIEMSGTSRNIDFTRANAEMKKINPDFKKMDGDGYTWHHMDDYFYDELTGKSYCTMQLVETKIHSSMGMTHSGSVAQMEKFTGILYND